MSWDDVSVELEVARGFYIAALERWLADPCRQEVQSRSRLELGAAGRNLVAVLRAEGVPGDGRMPERPFG